MRIPSQFNDSSLYRPRRGEKNERKRAFVPASSDSRRRLIRLAVALLLVIVVMREARRPGLYQTFFASNEEIWTATSTLGGGDMTTVVAAAADGSASPLQRSGPADWEGAGDWVDSMDVATQRAWIKSLMRLRIESAVGVDQPAAPWPGLTADQFADSLDSLTASSNTSPNVRAALDSQADVLTGAKTATDDWRSVNEWWSGPLLDALDASALSRVSDGTFWLGSDSDAFYLQLARTDELSARGVMTTGTLPLLQQPDVYRGELVRLVGRLGQAQQKQAQENDFGIQHYWKLWMIPEDGGIRPTVLIATEIPLSLSSGLDDDGKWDRSRSTLNPSGQFSAVGRFIKRLPYRSSLGADLAPVVIGRVIATREMVPTTTTTARSGAAANQDPGTSSLVWGVLLAIVAGVAIAAGLMYGTSVDARRSRRLRQLASPDSAPDLSSLVDTANVSEAPIQDGEQP
ncbi:hypothetical protein NHH03_23975 [Stieleria sp. TO1_6]|uniref:hypothetical protein n=1 Tax=Stieleria tagensis TaxID=2956795 RepID=UPI00209AF7D8|nr:hypothetical protein [Stieleria tagensis]MCO8124817.1 hypothetical protein [Stieleria tagensis]